MQSPLLTTKLYFPAARPSLVQRLRLVDRLQTGLRCPLTLVSAPAGSGKTTLLSEWRAGPGAGMPVAWISLEASDNDLLRFFQYLVAALDLVQPGIANKAVPLLQSSEQPNAEAILTFLVNALGAVSQDFALVMDDYHVIETTAVHLALNFMLDHLPPRMHIVLLTRSDPALPLARLRVRGQLTEIRAEHLRFTEEEAAAFLNQVMGLDLTVAQVAALEKRTEGWIAGLQLAALSVQGRKDIDGFVSAFTGSNRYIVDYLVEEVLSRQPADVREFLLRTSILERMNASLCTVLTGEADGQSILERFERDNLFIIPLDDHHTWYRYHHMFAELLRRQLMLNEDRYQPYNLYRLAQSWFENNGFIDEAIGHALAGLNYEDAANLIERYAFKHIYRSETILVLNWLKALPRNYISSRPVLGVIDAWVSLLGPTVNARELIELKLQQLEEACTGKSPITKQSGEIDYQEVGWIIGQIATIRASLARIFGQDHETTVEFLTKALSHLPEQEIKQRGIIYNNLGVLYLALNSVSEAEAAFIKAKELGESCDGHYTMLFAETHLVEIAKRRGNLRDALRYCQTYLPSHTGFNSSPEVILPIHGALYISLGHILLERNDLAESDSILAYGIELLKLSGELEILLRGYACLARLKQVQGDFSSAFNLLETARTIWPDAHVYIGALKTRLDLAQKVREMDDSDKLLRWARTHCDELYRNDEIPAISPSGERLFVILLTVCRVFIAYHPINNSIDLGFIHRYLKKQIRFAELRGWRERVIELSITDALAWQSEKENTNALASIRHALEIARTEGYILTFIEGGDPIQKLLDNLRTTLKRQSDRPPGQKIEPLLQYIHQLLSSFPLASSETAMVSKDPVKANALSKRELEVLQQIAAGCSNKEIAAELYISIGTVKRHTVNIFNKLDVKNRTEAVAKARELGLL